MTTVITRLSSPLSGERIARSADPAVYAAVSLVLISVAVPASYLPARRAARIDPVREA